MSAQSQEAKMSDLKPCPFCGGKPYLANVAMAGCAYVVCTDCRVQSVDGTQDRVRAAWNTRADLPPTPEQLMADPRVVALADAAKRASRATTDKGAGRFYTNEAIALQRALAQLKGPKP
jgi:hypothetical protein